MEYNSFSIKHHVRVDEKFLGKRRTVDVILRTKRKRNEILIKFPHYIHVTEELNGGFLY